MKFGTHKTVKAIFWPWLEPFAVWKSLKPFKSCPAGGQFGKSSEHGTCKTVKARSWPWLSGKIP